MASLFLSPASAPGLLSARPEDEDEEEDEEEDKEKDEEEEEGRGSEERRILARG